MKLNAKKTKDMWINFSLFRRVSHHGESKMAAQAGKSSSDRDGKNLCGRLFWETDALNK